MKISYNWLKQYCNINIPAEEVAQVLTDCGLEVESIDTFQSIPGGLEGIVIGEVKTRIQHPNADRLSLTTVNVGTGEPLQIVCGAANVAAGQKVVVALVGATLYPSGGASFQISKSKIRGEVSEGMICAEDEIGLGSSHAGIIVLEPSAKVGMPAGEYFKIENDKVFEIGLTPNRADAASHLGVARDLCAALKFASKPRQVELTRPEPGPLSKGSQKLTINIHVEDHQACPRYTGLILTNVKVGPSPQWLKNRLSAIGINPINNVVDITNFVLHECGQPLHAFDADKIAGGQIRVKKLPENTPFVTLDGQERKLSAEDLMICDEVEPLCIAGVYGGKDSGVTENTVNVFLESACFDPGSIRTSSKRHNLKTDAAFRFERGVDINLTEYALKRAATLMTDIADAQVGSDISDIYPQKFYGFPVELSYATVDRLIGNSIDKSTVKNILKALEIKVTKEREEGLSLLVPSFKVDVKREADVIEEILRIYGYNNITLPSQVRSSLPRSVEKDAISLQNLVSAYLSDNGFREMMNLSLTNPSYYEKFGFEKGVEILNPLSQELGVLRQTHLFGALEVIEHNKNRKNADLKLYEWGKVYFKGQEHHREEKRLSVFVTGRLQDEGWNTAKTTTDLYFLKGLVDNILKKLGLTDRLALVSQTEDGVTAEGIAYSIKGKSVARLGIVKNACLKAFDISQPVYYAELYWDQVISLFSGGIQYKELSKFPAVRRDLSLLLDRAIQYNEIEKTAFEAERNYLTAVNLFDVYEGDKIEAGKKSYALSFTLVNETETLTDKQIEKSMSRIMEQLEQKLGAVIRKG